MTSLLSLPAPLGYWPKLSWPWLATGNRAVRLTQLETGDTYDLVVDGYPHGWLDPTTLLVTRMLPDDTRRHLLRVTPPDGLEEEVAERIGFQQVSASDGHWAAWDTTSRLWYDGAMLSEGHHGMRQCGEWVAGRSVVDAYALRLYRGGQFERQVTKQAEVYDWAVREGLVVYGYPRVVAAYPSGRQADVTRSPWCEGSTGGSGFHLMLVDGVVWLWSAAQIDDAGAWGVLGGPVGDPAVIVVSVEASNLDVQRVGDRFVVAAATATGAVEVVAVPVDAPRTRLERPVPPPPVASFALDKTGGPVPLTVTASLTSANLTTWRWTLDGVIHQPIEGQTHPFTITAPGVHTVGLRTSPAVDVPAQTVTATAAPTSLRFYGLQTFELIPDEWAATIAAKGWGRVRVEGTDYDRIMAQCQKYELWPLFILRRGQEATVPGGISVEVGNECNAGCAPDWPKLTPAEYAAWVLEAWPTLLGKGCVTYVGAANNTSPAGIAWTKDVLSRLPMHPDLRVSFHRYPDGDQDVLKPKKGYRAMADEDAAILACVAGRRWIISEAGLVDASGTTGWWFWRKRWERQAVDGHRTQAARFERLGADAYFIYQLQGEHGIRTVDGRWKATADLPHL